MRRLREGLVPGVIRGTDLLVSLGCPRVDPFLRLRLGKITCLTQERSAAASAAAASGGAVSSIRAPQSASWLAISGTVSAEATGVGTPPAARMACPANT